MLRFHQNLMAMNQDSQEPTKPSDTPLAPSYIAAGQLYPLYRVHHSPRRRKTLQLDGSSKIERNYQSKINELRTQVNSSDKMRMSRSLLFLTTCIICIAGGSWQLYTILDNFLQYDMISQVFYTKDNSVIPPAFSLCLPYAELINATTLNGGFDQVDRRFWLDLNSSVTRDEASAQIQDHLTVADIFNQTPSLSDLLMSAFVRVRGTYRVNYHDLSNVSFSKYVKDDLVCYQIHYKGQNKIFQKPEFFLRSHHITYGQEPGVHMIIQLFREKIYHVSKAIIYLHPFGQLPRGDRDFPLNFITFDSSQLFADSSSYIGITYYKANLNLLQPPFPTDCKNFSNFHPPFAKGIRLESLYHCIHICMRVKTLERFNASSFTTTFEESLPYHIMTKYSVYTDVKREKEFDQIFDQCTRLCPGKSCHQVFYMPALITTRESDDIVFVLYDMAGLETTATFQPKMGLVELLVQVLSVSGVWLGLSCVDIIMTLIQLLARDPTKRFRRHRYADSSPKLSAQLNETT